MLGARSILVLLLGALAVASTPPGAAPREADPPVAVFADLDGTWQGTFVGYDERGRELYRIRVEQTYRTVDETTQQVTIRDAMPDGSVISGEGANTAQRRPDGSLALRCVVNKSNGERAEHEGRLVRGPDGDEQIIWHSRRPGRVEIFRETVRRERDGAVYEINGTGRYGEQLMLMHGRYRKKE